MKKVCFIVILFCWLTDVYSQIKVSVEHIEKDSSINLSILNTGKDTIMIYDSHHNRLSIVRFDLYSQGNPKPYETWCTLGTYSGRKRLPIIQLGPKEVYNFTYSELTSWENRPYNKVEVYYEIVYKKGSLINPTKEFKTITGHIGPFCRD